jgi:hypothetical protein
MSTAALNIPDPMSGPQLRTALLTLIKGANAPVNVVLQEIKSIGETLSSELDYEGAYNLLKIRSLGVDDEVLAQEGGALSDAEFAKRLRQKSRQTVHNYRETGKIFAVPRGSRNFLYPAWQIYRGALLKGLDSVLHVLNEKRTPPHSIVDFFLTEAEALEGKRPLDLLRAGGVDEVVAHAHRYGDIGS